MHVCLCMYMFLFDERKPSWKYQYLILCHFFKTTRTECFQCCTRTLFQGLCLDIYSRKSRMDIQAQPQYDRFEDVY